MCHGRTSAGPAALTCGDRSRCYQRSGIRSVDADRAGPCGGAGPAGCPNVGAYPTSAREGGVRGERETDTDLARLQGLLDQRPARVERLELPEADLVGTFQALLAERALRALRRAAHDRGLTGALAREVGQRLQPVLVGEGGGDRERVLVRR